MGAQWLQWQPKSFVQWSTVGESACSPAGYQTHPLSFFNPYHSQLVYSQDAGPGVGDAHAPLAPETEVLKTQQRDFWGHPVPVAFLPPLWHIVYRKSSSSSQCSHPPKQTTPFPFPDTPIIEARFDELAYNWGNVSEELKHLWFQDRAIRNFVSIYLFVYFTPL